MQTPSFSRHARTLSPPLSNAGSSHAFTIGPTTPGQQQKINVTRLAIEGKVKDGFHDARIRMYLKISLPAENLTPESAIPLFPEENLKILNSQVHPLDSNSAPYDFTSSTSPLLHNAARALGLPRRTQESYLSLFGHQSSSRIPHLMSPAMSRASSSSSASGVNSAPLDDRYTGIVTVIGYYVTYVLPKEFPPRYLNGYEAEYSGRSTPSSRPRASVGERNIVQFMAAIDMAVPLTTRPPRAPYMLSVPTPRCLSNHIRLRLFLPEPSRSTASSFASLSSAEESEPASWDLHVEPHVTRSTSSHHSRSQSSNYSERYAVGQLSDDESSESSSTVGFSDGCGIQGTFPSAERIRIRWAKPIMGVNGSDEMRRVGVTEAKGEMIASVLGRARTEEGDEGVAMRIDYRGTCSGVWFPGAATKLGLDVGLESQGCDVRWLPGSPPGWEVSGSQGFIDWNAGSSQGSHTQSLEPPEIAVSTRTPNGHAQPTDSMLRHNGSGSVSSLLRAPLPAHNVPDYSFEGSPASSPSGTVSSLSAPASAYFDGKNRAAMPNGVSGGQTTKNAQPGMPLTIQLNINHLMPPAKNLFSFSISGTLLVIPQSDISHSRSSSRLGDFASDIVAIPRLRVLVAEKESVSTVVRNEIRDSTVEIYNAKGDVRDAQTRKTVVQPGSEGRCGSSGGRVTIKSFAKAVKDEERNTETDKFRSVKRSQVHDGHTRSRVNSTASAKDSKVAESLKLRRRRDGPLIITRVHATITPLLAPNVEKTGRSGADVPDSYAVSLTLPAPADADTEWLEFGLAQSGFAAPAAEPSSGGKPPTADDGRPPRPELICVSVGGVPVRYENTVAVPRDNDQGDVPALGEGGKKWLSWVRVHVGVASGEDVRVVYQVKVGVGPENCDGKSRNKQSTRLPATWGVFLPCFALPVGELLVDIETPTGLVITSLRSNLAHEQVRFGAYGTECHRLRHYASDMLFLPSIAMTLDVPASKTAPSRRLRRHAANAMPFLTWTAHMLLLALVLVGVHNLAKEIQRRGNELSYPRDGMAPTCATNADTFTITATTTATLTVHAMPSAEPSSRKSTPKEPSASERRSTTLPSPEVTIWPDPMPEQTPVVVTPDSTAFHRVKPEATAMDHRGSLLPTYAMPFTWPLQFDFDITVPRIARQTAHSLVHQVHKLWQVMRTIYHYPLPPT
ncbi:hypothetical protein PUNSTDRAFT_144651 [Punctularia strigosozonata HHB-11173 SS5]|uniref:uncharacterized protein n=1 Tax=Punctularia strigosozonata (strain HHB-11173) TaxID=741275 RepID=UPI000441679D|nr:uncharacterized protein PUNSTDRAFT_144651 [Punctularia strigosozonata HHB-11173 SS5]EIN07094.1 hypothetical protein PUNSTDRAFT_144651 [Punctularia strigosozonata HHB-11173 SS5]